jgi:hypothetical protein
MHVFIHLFEPDFFVAEYFADENPPLVPADVSAVIHPPGLERSWILKVRFVANIRRSRRTYSCKSFFIGIVHPA